MTEDRITHSVGETIELGRTFAGTLRSGSVVGLVGPLGSGKTQFVKGICDGLQVETEVLSPSFVLMHRYDGTLPDGQATVINHYDFYRIVREEELDEIGFRDLVGGDGITLVEWADAFKAIMPPRSQTVTFAHGDREDDRSIRIGAVEGT